MPMFLVNFMRAMLAIATSADNGGIGKDEMDGSEPDWHGREDSGERFGRVRKHIHIVTEFLYLWSMPLCLPSSSDVTM
jgi:hypothetical protein